MTTLLIWLLNLSANLATRAQTQGPGAGPDGKVSQSQLGTRFVLAAKPQIRSSRFDHRMRRQACLASQISAVRRFLDPEACFHSPISDTACEERSSSQCDPTVSCSFSITWLESLSFLDLTRTGPLPIPPAHTQARQCPTNSARRV